MHIFKTLALASALVVAAVTESSAQQTTLRLSHFTPANSNTHVRMLQPWAERVERDSGGKLRIQIFPSLQLGGTVTQLFDQVRDGVVDIAWIYPSASANRFPCIEIFDAPFVGRGAAGTSEAMWEYVNRNCMDEFKGVRPIAFHAFASASVHSKQPIRTLEDFAGKKIRAPSAMANKMVSLFGATPVAMPFTQIAEAMSRGVVDGLTVGMESVPTLKIDEMVNNHTVMPSSSPALYAAALMLAINPNVYERLPADLRAAVDRNSGAAASRALGSVWDDLDRESQAAVKARGNNIYVLSIDEAKRWSERSEAVRKDWIATMNARGRDGEALYRDALSAIAAKN